MSQNTEVKMVPAVTAANRTMPGCSTPNPMGSEGLGLALLNGGAPVNNTGLPPNCWPQYTNAITGPLSWPTDGREGGVPDPTTAGPPIIQRATSSLGPWTTVGTVGNVTTFTNAGLSRRTTHFYRVIANNLVGYTQTYAPPATGYPTTSADSAPSNATSITTN